MYAYEIPGMRFSGVAGAAIARYTLVAPKADGTFINTTAESKNVVGVAMNDPKQGEVLEIADGIVKVIASDTIAIGDPVKLAADGKVAKDAGATAKIGVALTDGKANGQVTIKLK